MTKKHFQFLALVCLLIASILSILILTKPLLNAADETSKPQTQKSGDHITVTHDSKSQTVTFKNSYSKKTIPVYYSNSNIFSYGTNYKNNIVSTNTFVSSENQNLKLLAYNLSTGSFLDIDSKFEEILTNISQESSTATLEHYWSPTTNSLYLLTSGMYQKSRLFKFSVNESENNISFVEEFSFTDATDLDVIGWTPDNSNLIVNIITETTPSQNSGGKSINDSYIVEISNEGQITKTSNIKNFDTNLQISTQTLLLKTSESFNLNSAETYSATGFTVLHPNDKKVYNAGSLGNQQNTELISFARCNAVDSCQDGELFIHLTDASNLTEWLKTKNYFERSKAQRLPETYAGTIYPQTFLASYPAVYPAVAYIEECINRTGCATVEPTITLGIQLSESKVVEAHFDHSNPLLLDIVTTIKTQ